MLCRVCGMDTRGQQQRVYWDSHTTHAGQVGRDLSLVVPSHDDFLLGNIFDWLIGLLKEITCWSTCRVRMVRAGLRSI